MKIVRQEALENYWKDKSIKNSWNAPNINPFSPYREKKTYALMLARMRKNGYTGNEGENEDERSAVLKKKRDEHKRRYEREKACLSDEERKARKKACYARHRDKLRALQGKPPWCPAKKLTPEEIQERNRARGIARRTKIAAEQGKAYKPRDRLLTEEEKKEKKRVLDKARHARFIERKRAEREKLKAEKPKLSTRLMLEQRAAEKRAYQKAWYAKRKEKENKLARVPLTVQQRRANRLAYEKAYRERKRQERIAAGWRPKVKNRVKEEKAKPRVRFTPEEKALRHREAQRMYKLRKAGLIKKRA